MRDAIAYVSFAILLHCLTVPMACGDDNWPGFRCDGSGLTNARNLPENWSPEEGIAWKASVPGYGQSAPVVWKGKIFLTSSDGPFQESLQVHAFDLDSGKRIWTRELKATKPVENYFRNSRAAPSCVVDANAAYTFFASGDVTAFSHDGDVRWTVPLIARYGSVDNERGIASSLAQTADYIFVVVDHSGPSYIVAIDKANGEIAWKVDRGNRVPSWSSPVVTRFADKDMVLISSSDTVDAYDATTGKLLWQHTGLQGNHIPSASIVGNRVFVGSTSLYMQATDPEKVAGSNCCIELTSNDGLPAFKVRWGAQHANSYYSTPLALGGYVYYVNKVGVLYCIDEESGRQVYAKRIGNPCWASAIGVKNSNGENRIYFVMTNGFTVVLRPGSEYDQIARNQLWSYDELTDASEAAAQLRKANALPADEAKPKEGPEKVFAGLPEAEMHKMFSYGDPTVYGVAAVDGNLLIRTGQHLYCVRQNGNN